MSCLSNYNQLMIENKNIKKILNIYQLNGKSEFYIKEKQIVNLLDNNINVDSYYLSLFLNYYKKQEFFMENPTIKELDKKYKLPNDIYSKEDEETIKKIIYSNNKPKNSRDLLVKNIKIAIIDAYKNHMKFKFSIDQIRTINTNLYMDKNSETNYKKITDSIIPLQNQINDILNNKKIEGIHAIVACFSDFNNLHLFNNIELSLIIMFNQLLSIFPCLKYYSFFERIYREKELFYNNIKQSIPIWNSLTPNIYPIIEQIINIIDSLYKTIDNEYVNITSIKMTVQAQILNTINILGKRFAKKDIISNLPQVSTSSIDKVLNELKNKNSITSIGVGKNAFWEKLNTNNEFNLGDLFPDQKY
jgi:hypothetical protein